MQRGMRTYLGYLTVVMKTGKKQSHKKTALPWGFNTTALLPLNISDM